MPAYKYTLKDGKTTKWYANFYYIDWTGEKQHACKRGFLTQREAKEYERTFLDQLRKSSDIAFVSLVDNYIEDMRQRLKLTTMATKEHIIRNHIIPYFNRLKVNDIDTLAVRKWQNQILSYRDEKGSHLSPTYVKTINNQLSAILNYAVNHYGLTRNPCKSAGSMGKGHADEMGIWTKEQFENFIKHEKKSSYHLAFDILFYTGIREGELLALTPNDISQSMHIDINKTYAVVKGTPITQDTKTAKSKRTVAIPEFLYNEINGYLAKLSGLNKTDRIFSFTKSALLSEIKRISEMAGVPVIRIHDLRHSHASMLIDMGVDILEISRRLGHESAKTTMDTYGHLYPNKDLKIALRINQDRLDASN